MRLATGLRNRIGTRRQAFHGRRLFADALDHFLPRRCLLCECPCGSSPLCAPCGRFLPGADRPRCLVCARPWQTAAHCAACRETPPAFDVTVVAADYAPPLDRAITTLKFAGRIGLAHGLGGLLADAMARPPGSQAPALDRVVPVPLAAARLAGRGFNQSQLIAQALHRRWRNAPAGDTTAGVRRPVPPLRPDLLVRQRDTVAQSLLTWRARQANLDHGFVATADLAGLWIGVVDDVMTTGATLQAAARALKAAGAAGVVNLVVARTA